MLPLGHATFVGIGAYTSTVLSLQYGISPWIGMLVGAVLSCIVGVIIGLPTFKMRGAYFALATIAFAERFTLCARCPAKSSVQSWFSGSRPFSRR